MGYYPGDMRPIAAAAGGRAPPLRTGKRCTPFSSQSIKLSGEFGRRISRGAWGLKWARLEVMIIKRAVKPDTQLPRHLKATKGGSMITLAAMCCSVTRDPQLVEQVQHV